MRTLRIVTLLALVLLGHQSHSQSPFVFPDLPYGYSSLEVFIDKTTMEIHHSRHHRAYFNNFVKAAKELGIDNMLLGDIFSKVSQYPATIRNNGGGYYNHNLFWEVMSPSGGGAPSAVLSRLITADFGSFEEFKRQFEAAATGQFGSGWAWLSVGHDGKLFVSSTANQDNPLMDVVEKRGIPIFGLDVWEHAYYLQYQNKRGDYVANFWKVVNWSAVEEKYSEAIAKL
jgi:superoxide dismutase, Fe-Mn family